MNTAPKLTVMSDTRFIPAAATPAIEVLSAEKIYSNGTRALLPVNLTINQGEFITLLGPSGCGKSTLLKMVAGLVEPSDGKLMLWRRDSREKAQHPLSFVFQEATLMPWSSVRNNVRLPLDLAGVPRARPFPCMPVSCRTVCCRPASQVWSHNMKTTTATPWIQHPRFLKILYPTLVAVAMVLLWQGAVSYFRIPAFLVPSPLVMLESLWTHLTPLLLALLFTLKITLISFLLSIVIGAAVAFILVQNRFVETALFPYIVFLQVTPIVAIAPLIIIWVKDATLSLVVCATLMAVFPIISNTTQGLRSVSPGLLSYFRLNHASRWQTLVRLRIPSALPYFFGALRISSGLSLIGAVVAEFVAGTGGTNTGLAYQILQAGYQLDIPLMFAALLLISLAGIALFGVMSWVSRRALSAWHESEAVQSH
ncbi:MAG: ABC transporter permease subunit [Klebsiella pneumoniae]|nr:ABC transporter permease subunit [Klebsiella pneumoniae]